MADTETAKQSITSTPGVKELLKAGVQFGHETKRWNPKMAPFIFGAKNNIHVMDITKTMESLQRAVTELEKLAAKGDVLMVGTKRQATDLIRKYALESGSHFMASRWVGGFFTNFNQVQRSLRRLKELETAFESGVEGHTKYEISRMKLEWQKLNRMYEGVKTVANWPAAVIVIDPRYEKGAVKESRKAGIPVFALADSNCDPETVDYIIPGNDDALGSIEIVLSTLSEAIKNGRGSRTGVEHNLKDYSKAEVKIIKKVEEVEPVIEIAPAIETPVETEAETAKPAKSKAKAKKASKEELEGGILGRSRSK